MKTFKEMNLFEKLVFLTAWTAIIVILGPLAVGAVFLVLSLVFIVGLAILPVAIIYFILTR